MNEYHEEILKLQKECIRRVEFYIGLAEKKLNVSLPMPKINFCISGGVAGRALIQENRIDFNPKLIRLNPVDFMERTPGHEVAHLISHSIHKYKRIDPHGEEWKRVMWAFSLPAIRCHNYKMSEGDTRKTPQPYREGNKTIVNLAVGKVISFD